MSQSVEADIQLVDLRPAKADFGRELLSGLSSKPKWIPSKFFYDDRGSRLFELISELPEYYLTRSEIAILKEHRDEMADVIGRNVTIIEYGSGNGVKTQLLLAALKDPASYLSIDISEEALLSAANRIREAFPTLPLVPILADYSSGNDFSRLAAESGRPIVFFPGSTIGNFRPREAEEFLSRVSRMIGRNGLLLIGVDLKKDPEVLHAAYNDSAGITASFNKNLLQRANGELAADFNLDAFHHYAFYHPVEGCMQMHLLSDKRQIVTVGGRRFAFDEGESIQTEWSYKYTVQEFIDLAARAGLRHERTWKDENCLFSVHLLGRLDPY